MGFQKGHKLSGSRKDIKNKKTETWEVFAEYCLTGGLEKFRTELDSLKGKDFVNSYLALLEYHKPKLSRGTVQSITIDYEKLTDEQLEKLLTAKTEAEILQIISGQSA